jgi:hypothetical protein
LRLGEHQSEWKDHILGLEGDPPKDFDAEAIYVHLREGDINRMGLSEYMQPNCRFYTDAIAQSGAPRVRVIVDPTQSEQLQHPCREALRAVGAIFEGDKNPLVDLKKLMHARKFAAARSTFSRAALAMTRVKKIFWTFEDRPATEPYRFSHWVGWDEFGSHSNCRVSDEYLAHFGRWWKVRDAKSLQLFFEENCTWELIPERPR